MNKRVNTVVVVKPKHQLTRSEAKALRMIAKVGMEQARDEPVPKLAAMQRTAWRKALEKAWPPLRVVKAGKCG